MSERWDQLGRPDVETMLGEIALYDGEAAALARAVWEQINAAEQDSWREQIATAILSYRAPPKKSRIAQIATERLARLNDS
jgi:hypothetical protein